MSANTSNNCDAPKFFSSINVQATLSFSNSAEKLPSALSISSKTSFQETTPGQKIVSACAGSLVTSLVVTPFDVIKTRLQFQSIKEKSIHQSVPSPYTGNFGAQPLSQVVAYRPILYSRWPMLSQNIAPLSLKAPTTKFTGTTDALIKIVRHEGITKLWRGLSTTVAQQFPSTIIYYVGYDALRDYLSAKLSDSPSLGLYSPLIAGGLAKSLSATIISPMELFRTRLQSTGPGKSTSDVFGEVSDMVRQQGVRSLWRGLKPTLWRDIPFSGIVTILRFALTLTCLAIYWMSYETIKGRISNSHGGTISVFQLSFAAGASSGVLAALLTAPFDVIKTRCQIGNAPNSLEKSSQHGTLKILLKVVRQEGWRKLFSGLTARIAKVTPVCAIMVSSYEFGKTFFTQRSLLDTSD